MTVNEQKLCAQGFDALRATITSVTLVAPDQEIILVEKHERPNRGEVWEIMVGGVIAIETACEQWQDGGCDCHSITERVRLERGTVVKLSDYGQRGQVNGRYLSSQGDRYLVCPKKE